MSLAALALALLSCAGAPIRVDRGGPEGLPADARPCFSAPSDATCAGPLEVAFEEGDRALAGQLMLLMAPATQGAVRDVARAALWLNRQPTLPADMTGLPADLEDLELPAPEVPAGAVLVFPGVTAEGVPSGAPLVPIDLSLPPAGGPALASRLAAAAGASAALVATPSGPVVAPAAPQLSRIVGATITLPVDAVASAVLVGEAERALRDGRTSAASLLIERAIAALPEGAPPCSVRATLLLARREIDVSAHALDLSDNTEEIEEACTEAEVAPSEQPVQRWMKAWIFARASRHTAASPADRPDEWTSAEGQKRWAATARAAAGEVGGVRAALLNALVDELLGASEEPAGPCDEETPARQRAAAKEAARALTAAGRPDLALPLDARAVLRADGTVDRAAVTELLVALDDPRVRWAREPLLTTAVSTASLGAFSAADPGAVAPLCHALFAELAQAVKGDREEGFTERNVSRMTAAFTSGPSCPNRLPMEALLDDVLAASIEGNDGGSGFLALLVGTGTHFLQNLLSGRVGDLVATARTLVSGMGRLRERLGDSAEHRALSATLSALEASMALFVGGVDAPLDQLAEAAADLDRVAAEPVAEGSPMMVRIAPGLHLGALALLAAGHAAGGDAGAAQSVLVTLDQALPDDTRDLLKNLDAEDHSTSIVAIVRAARGVIEAGIEGSLSSLEQARGLVEAAQVRGATEAGWWALGLDMARAALWDGLAAIAFAADQPAVAQAALAQAEGVVAQVVREALAQWELAGTGWELLAVLPTLHEVGGRAIVEDRSATETVQMVLAAVDAPIKDAVSRLRTAVEGSEQPGLVELLVDVLVIASDVGLARIAEGGEALETLADRLGDPERMKRFPPELRVYLDTGAAVIAWEADRARSLALLERAERTAAGSALASYAYLPGLVRTRLVADSGELDDALSAVDNVLPAGDEALTCDRFHAVHALLPYRAWLLAALGRPGEWRAAWRRYTELVDQGFTGEGLVSCQLMSYRDNLIAGLNVAQLVRGMVLPVSQEGTFQINLGLQAQERVHERLLCQAAPVGARRPDVIMQAHLAAAVYALLEGDDATAQTAMLRALDEGRLLIHGTVAALGANAAGALSTARENTYLPLVAWAGVLARLRGHAHLGAQIHDVGLAMAEAQGTSLLAAVTDEEELPMGLRRLPRLEPLRPVVLAWLASSQPSDLPALRTAIEKANKISKFAPAWAPQFAVSVQAVAIGPLANAAKEALAQPLPKDATGKAIVGGWHLLLRLVLDETVGGDELLAVIAAYADAGLPGEAGGFALKLGNIAYQNGNLAGAVALLEPASQTISRATAPVLHAELLVRPTEARLARAELDEGLLGLRVMWDELHGRVPPNEELQQRLALVNLLGLMKKWDELGARVAELLPLIGPGFGWQNPTVYRLRTVQVALDALDGTVEEARIAPVLEWKEQVTQADDATETLRALREAVGKPDAVKRIAEEFLTTLFAAN